MQKRIRKVVHRLRVGDVEDPEIYIAYAWDSFGKTEKGQWVLDNCHDLMYTNTLEQGYYGHSFNISGKMTEEKWTYFLLKWGSDEN